MYEPTTHPVSRAVTCLSSILAAEETALTHRQWGKTGEVTMTNAQTDQG